MDNVALILDVLLFSLVIYNIFTLHREKDELKSRVQWLEDHYKQRARSAS